jgi:hypothetical protein
MASSTNSELDRAAFRWFVEMGAADLWAGETTLEMGTGADGAER